MSRVGTVHFEKELQKLLTEYGIEVREIANKYVKESADIALKMVRKNSKVRTGEYASDWASKGQYYRGVGTAYIVYNKKHYRLTHLLENRREVKDRNRKSHGFKDGDGVIAEAQDYAGAWLMDNIVKELQG